MVAGSATAATSQPADSQPVQYTLTTEQRQQIEERFYSGIERLAEEIAVQFDRSMPDDYQRFAEYKVKDWLPRYNKLYDVSNRASNEFAGWNFDPEYQRLRNYHSGLFELNSATIFMQNYLMYKDKHALRTARDKMGKVQELVFPHTIEN